MVPHGTFRPVERQLRRDPSQRHPDSSGIGIDLGDDGIDPIDTSNALPPRAGAGNSGQNQPSPSAVVGDAATAWACGSLANANGWHRIDFHGATSCTTASIGGMPIDA